MRTCKPHPRRDQPSLHNNRLFLDRIPPKDKVIVTYCAGVHCNASTKAAARLTALGFKVKEMLDGIEGWRKEGYALETSTVTITA
jgi:rhodanese-related sulfurtransferase